MRKILYPVALALLAAACTPARPSWPVPGPDNTVDIQTFADCQAYFHYDPSRDIMISAHRGGMQEGFPENCIASCEKTLSMMPTFFEIDFSLTKDSVMVLMHDLTVDRTTDGTGRVADYTWEELQQLHLVDRQGNVTEYRIPSLQEMLEWGKGKVAFNFDNKYINTKGVSDEDKARALDYYRRQLLPGGDWAEYRNMFLSVRSLEEAMYYWNAGVQDVMFCVEISKPEHFAAYDASPIPWDHIVAASRTAINPEMQEIYDKLHDLGVMVIVSVTQTDDKIKNPRDRRVAYLRTLLSEPDLIETDYPADWVGLPVSRKEIHALQDAALKGSRKRR